MFQTLKEIREDGFGKVFKISDIIRNDGNENLNEPGKKSLLVKVVDPKRCDQAHKTEIKHMYELIISIQGEFINYLVKPISLVENVLYLIFEYFSKGSLYNYIYYPKDKKNGLGEKLEKFIFHKILIGLKVLHENHIYHFDL